MNYILLKITGEDNEQVKKKNPDIPPSSQTDEHYKH